MAPDLNVIVRSPALNMRRAQTIADSSWPADGLAVWPGAKLAWRLTGTGFLPGRLFIAAHDIPSDSADWNADKWLFESEGLIRFEKTLSRLYELLPEEFTIEACWGGDAPKKSESITRPELLTLLSLNRLGNRVRYRVGSSTGDPPAKKL